MTLPHESQSLRELAEKAALDLEAFADYFGYQVFPNGDIFSYKRGFKKKMSVHADRRGYLKVSLVIGGAYKEIFVHAIVARCFHGPRPSDKHMVRHLDGNKNNCTAGNLSWGTAQDNADDRERHGNTARGEKINNAKLNISSVAKIKERINNGVKYSQLAEQFGVSVSAIKGIKIGKSWGYVAAYPDAFKEGK